MEVADERFVHACMFSFSVVPAVYSIIDAGLRLVHCYNSYDSEKHIAVVCIIHSVQNPCQH